MIDVGSIWGEEGMRFDNSFAIAVWLTLFILIISTVIFILIILRARTNRNWQEAATELGLNFTPSNLFWLPYEMNGTLDGGYYCRVHTWREHRSGGSGSSGSNAPVTGVEVRFLESLRMGFNLSPSTGIKWFDSLMGVDDTEVGGDPDFDQMFAISSTDDMKLKRFLTAERKEILKAATTEMPYFEISDSGISTEAEMIRDKESIVHIVMSFKELAMALTFLTEPDIFATPSIDEDSKSIFD
jgi:hypothetical protein